ncbi:hypothetical protein PNQ29_00005 [Halobacterium salinarum]|uniref:hypothetical protein n=1 Tax=Halobacterium salinarum TaxID=2242 RepID=UPI00255783D0|nr:hypothetical protein [Halobacterium salinarum]MDL0118143.1 hypothetical protein [Halobacterium salinarum]
MIDDIESPYVWYNESYYTWTVSTHAETTNATIRMTPTDPDSVFENLSRPVADAPREVQTAIEHGESIGLAVESGLYQQHGTYYVVAPENEGAVLTELASIFAGFALTPVGRGYVAVALGLLGYRYREPTRDRLLTVRRATVLPALAVAVALIGTGLFESGSLTRFVTGPTSAFVVAAGTVAGVLSRQRRWLWLGGVTVGTGVLATAAITAALGLVGLIFGPAIVLLSFITGVVPFGYGYWFAQESPATQ